MNHIMAMQPEDAVPWIDLEAELSQETARQWTSRFKDISANECNRLLITLSRIATNTQSARLFRRLEQQQNQNRQQIERWKATMTRLAPNIFSEPTRYKRIISERDSHWLIRYVRSNPTSRQSMNSPSPAIIGFTGNMGLLMAPIPCVLAALAQTQYDLIVVRRRYKESFFSNNGHSLQLICKQLQALLKSQLKSSITLGTSSGGMAAVCVADALHLPLGIAIGAGADARALGSNETIDNTSRILRRLSFPISWRREKTKLLLAAPADNQSDAKSSISIRDHYNNDRKRSTKAFALLFSNCSKHTLPSELSQRGITLDRFLLPMINQDISLLSEYLLDANSATQ